MLCTRKFIPVPGVDPVALARFFEEQSGTILDLFNMFSGGALSRLYTALKGFAPLPAEAASRQPDWNEAHGQRFRAAMEDDFNTPEAVAVLFDLAGALNRSRDALLAQQLRALAGVLGLLGRDSETFLQRAEAGTAQAGLRDQDIAQLIEARNAARAARNFAEADRLRQTLADAGIVLEDSKGGTGWRRA